MKQYTITVTPEEGAYIVSLPTLPGCHSVDGSLAEAIQNAGEAIALYLETLTERGEPIPEETDHPQLIVVNVAVR